MRGRPRLELPVAELVERYEAGENTYVLGRAYGVSDVTVGQRLRAAGVKLRPRGGRPGNTNRRARGGPLHNGGGGYLGTYDRGGRTCGIHRGCWAAHNGTIPEGHVVHHINGDMLDNAIENLACMTPGEHSELHRKAHKCT